MHNLVNINKTVDRVEQVRMVLTIPSGSCIPRKGAMVGVAQWIERQPVNQKVTSSIPSQVTCLGCGPESQ